jgi:hypothetical protein
MKKYLFFYLLFLLFGSLLPAQNPIKLQTNVDTSFTGSEIHLTIKLFKSIDSFKIKPFKIENKEVLNSDVDFEVSDFGLWKGELNTLFPSKTTDTSSKKINIIIWDEGEFVIVPSIDEQKAVNNDYLSSDYPIIYIQPSFDPTDSLRALAPVKDIIREKKVFSDYIHWYHYLILGGFIIAFAYYIYLKTRKGTHKTFIAQEPVEVVSPHIIAIGKLKRVKDEKPWLTGQEKAFHEQLTFILREYLENTCDIKALEQSTSEIIQSLDGIISDKEHLNTISEILQISDLIKFAKASMAGSMNEKFLNRTIDLITELHQAEK